MSIPALSGNLATDLSALKSMVDATGTNGTDEADFADAVAKEAYSQGDTQAGDTAHNISASLSDGTYSQSGSSAALLHVMGVPNAVSSHDSGPPDTRPLPPVIVITPQSDTSNGMGHEQQLTPSQQAEADHGFRPQ